MDHVRPEPVVGCDESDSLTGTALQLLRSWTRARSAAVFASDREGGLRLVMSEGIDQGAIDDARRLWQDLPLELRQGAAFRGKFRRDFLALPYVAAGRVRAFAYLERADAVGRPLPQLQALADIMAVCALCASAPEPGSGDEATPTAEPTRAEGILPAEVANLVFLLERNEWNVSRVARLLGVTRMTVYNRLRRGGVARRRIAKSGRRSVRVA